MFLSSPITFDPADFIETPEWAKIINKAKEVLEAFNLKLKLE